MIMQFKSALILQLGNDMRMNLRALISLSFASLLSLSPVFGRGDGAVKAREHSLFTDLNYSVSLQGSASFGDYTPMWLNANKWGLSSLEKCNGYLRASLERPLSLDEERKWGIGYGLDLAVAYHYTSRLVVQQAFVEGRWHKAVLTVGSKQYPMELKNQRLSSGSQTLGINARPVPQVRLALPEYWTLPFTNGWVSIKGHVAYGKTTDDNWQKDFASQQTKYTKNTLYHSKAGYLKIGNEYRFLPVSLELGLEMACQFGGTSWKYGPDGVSLVEVKNENGLKAFWNAFVPGGGEVVESQYRNASGNQLGSWMMRLNFDYDTWYLGLYADKFFEDQSSMFFLDYDGYGSGAEWDVKKDRRYIVYDFKDMMLGAELRLKNARWLNDIVFEYIYSKYQCGPVYHDHSPNVSDHVSGRDNFYNHYIFTGWQHWGQVMGNPLYMSPLYNEDGRIEVKNNRMYGFHLGLGGNPTYNLNYRVLATWQKSFGTYEMPYSSPRENISLLAEAAYAFDEESPLSGWGVSFAAGADFGKMRGDNYGVQLTVSKSGLFNPTKKK